MAIKKRKSTPQKVVANRLRDKIVLPKDVFPKYDKKGNFPRYSDKSFQNTINKKFAKFKLNKENQLTVAVCKDTKVKFDPFLYQLFIKSFMAPDSPYRGILLYHGLGSGKTCTSIITSKQYIKSAEKRHIIVLVPAALRTNYIKELLSCGEFENLTEIKKYYTFISYNSTNVLDKIDELPDQLNNKFVIIDEVHNIISSIMNQKGKIGFGIYKRILEAKNIKLLFLSGTPIINNPLELALLFQLLNPGILPVNQIDFNDKYVNKLQAINLDDFKTRIRGLVSYYIGANPTSEIFPQKKEFTETVKMSDYQFKIYKLARLKELKIMTQGSKKPETEDDTFRVFSRQISNFAFPQKLLLNRNPLKLSNADLKNLHVLSPKMELILKNIKKSPKGPILVYSNFKTIEGIEVFSLILQLHKITYIKWVGGISDKERIKILNKFNAVDNKDGKIIKVFLVTAAGAEGISLKNIRQVHIMEPHWNNVRIQQVIGRALRICSHFSLPKKDQLVEIYKYLSILPSNVKFEPLSTDQAIQKIADNKTILNDQFLDALKTVAVDCTLNLKHNIDVKKCF